MKMPKKGRTYRNRRDKRRKIESRNKQITLTLTDLSSNKREINIFPYEYIGYYHNKIMDLFDKYNTLIKFDIIKNGKKLDIHKMLYVQNIYTDQELSIVFSQINLIPLKLFEPYEIDAMTVRTYNGILDELDNTLNTDPLPNDIYYQIKSLFCFTRVQMKMRWFDHDIRDINAYSEGVKSRYDRTYRSICPMCLEGSNGHGHECLAEAIRFAEMLPRLLQTLDDNEPHYHLTF